MFGKRGMMERKCTRERRLSGWWGGGRGEEGEEGEEGEVGGCGGFFFFFFLSLTSSYKWDL